MEGASAVPQQLVGAGRKAPLVRDLRGEVEGLRTGWRGQNQGWLVDFGQAVVGGLQPNRRKPRSLLDGLLERGRLGGQGIYAGLWIAVCGNPQRVVQSQILSGRRSQAREGQHRPEIEALHVCTSRRSSSKKAFSRSGVRVLHSSTGMPALERIVSICPRSWIDR